MTSRTLICCAFPFGYGPAAKLLHVARGLRPLGLPLVFLGTGTAHELASRSTLFDEVVNSSPAEERTRHLVRSATGLLSLMDRDYAALAVEFGRPLFVADSLLWMRDQVPPVFCQARRYWAQEFVDVRPRLAEVGPNAVLVGPIVAPDDLAPRCEHSAPGTEKRTRLVVNLGGSDAPPGLAAVDPSFFDFVCRGLVQDGVPAAERPGAIMLAGNRCIRYLRTRYPGCGLEMVSTAHDDALALLRTARWVLTSPGLTACLECFQLGVPTYFLPPQNYSQWWILKKLRAFGLAPGSFHWEDVLPNSAVAERMPEAQRGTPVREAIRGLTSDRRAERLFREGLHAALGGDPRDLARRQRAFFDSLGPNGTATIVDELGSLCL
jgi:hypothetical protein